jgi:penicillin-binding protein 2
LNNQHKERQQYILALFGIAASVLLVKAFTLQVLNNDFKTRADAVAMSKETIYPARGLIYDRNERLLINNTPAYDLLVTYNQLDPAMDTAKFCRILGIDQASFRERLNKDFKRDIRYARHKPFVFMNKISPELYARLQESLYEFPGFFVLVRNVRSYPVRHAAHPLGYITEVTERDIDASDGAYVIGDYIGASGLELAYEKELKGTKGFRYVLKDNLGRDIGSFQNGSKDVLPQSGLDLVSTLDLDLQAYAEDLMHNKIGAIVAIEPSSGEILAFGSFPSYDPNLMVIDQNRGKAFARLQSDTLKPLFNRAIMAEYPPGSIFKSLVGLIGMQEQVITPQTGYSCPGYYTVGGNDVRNCRSHAPPVDVATALQWSCNSYFFRAFREIVDKFGFYNPEQGLEVFVRYLSAFGLGKALGVDFPGEKGGNIPSSAYYDRLYPKRKGGWRSPTIISLGIGQGELLLTTLQMANIAVLIANDGAYHIPHFAKFFYRNGNRLPPPERFLETKSTGIDPVYFRSVKDGMLKVVEGGTAAAARMHDISVAGKTGTVQNPHGEDHSTFIGFAPVNDPKIAIAVFVENAGGGSRYAAPIASLVMERYIRGSIASERRWLEESMRTTDLTRSRPRRRPSPPRDTLRAGQEVGTAPTTEPSGINR